MIALVIKGRFYEENMKLTGSKTLGFSARNLLKSEHCGTHSDKISDDKMPLEYFWGSAICIDVSHIRYPKYIEPEDLMNAVKVSGQEIRKGDIVLSYTGHHDKTYGTDRFQTGYTGLSYYAAKWLAWIII